jgi:hypothetical protein
MDKVIKRLTVFLIFSSGIIISSYCSDSLSIIRSKLYFDEITLNNIWINSSNPAGILFFEKFIPVNLLEMGYSHEKKELHFPAEPGMTSVFSGKAQGYRKIGKLTSYGSFSYENDHYYDLYFNNTMIFDPDNPYILGDSVGGPQRKEGFALNGKLAYPLSEKLSIGINTDYQNYIGAKNMDPRNKNIISSLEIIPGIIYSSGNISAGISGGPVIFNNDVSIQVMEFNYDMYQFMGYGYFKLLKNVVNYSNAYFGKGIKSEVQFRFQKSNYSNFTTLGFKSYSEEVRYGGTYRLTDGISDQLVFSFNNYQVLKGTNTTSELNLSFKKFYLKGTQVMQHFQTILEGAYSYDSLITDLRVEGKHIVSNFSGALEYRLTGHKLDNPEVYRFRLGISSEYQSVAHYPVLSNGSQEVLNFSIHSGYRRTFKLSSLYIIPEIGGAYRLNSMGEKTYTVLSTSFPEFQEQDFIARNSEFMQANASVSFLLKTSNSVVPEYFVTLNSVYTYFPDAFINRNNNYLFKITFGLVF